MCIVAAAVAPRSTLDNVLILFYSARALIEAGTAAALVSPDHALWKLFIGLVRGGSASRRRNPCAPAGVGGLRAPARDERRRRMPGNAGVLIPEKPGNAGARRRKMPGKARESPEMPG